MSGWIKSHRKMLEWRWFKDSATFHVFMYLVLKASHKQIDHFQIGLERGQLVTGYRAISRDTGLSVQSVRTIMNRLKSTQEITSKSTNKYTIVTICNYDEYQGFGGDDQQANQQANQQTTNKQPTSNQQATNTIQEVKKEKKVKKERSKTTVGQQPPDAVREVIGHLNERTGKNYKASSRANIEILYARFKEGFTVSDCKAAIDNQARAWMGTDSEIYLRPSTLFRASKLDGYVNNTRGRVGNASSDDKSSFFRILGEMAQEDGGGLDQAGDIAGVRAIECLPCWEPPGQGDSAGDGFGVDPFAFKADREPD